MKKILKQSIICEDQGKSEIEAKASAVNYNTDGKYTIQLTLEKVDFTGLTADDIKVKYSVFDQEAYNKALQESKDDTANVDMNAYLSDAQAKVTDADGDDSTLNLSFVDEKAAENVTNEYTVLIESKNIGALVEVRFTDYTLTPEVEYVLASDKDIQLTLTLDNSEFAENISEDNIQLLGSFSEMKIENLSAAGKNLTLQLTGKLVEHKSSGVYLDGFVDVDKDGIKNAYTVTRATVPVQTETARFESDKMTVDGSTVKVPLTLIDVVDIDTLTKDSFSFESGVEVTDCTKDSDTQVTLTMVVDGAKDKNSAAEILNGQIVKIGNDFELTAKFVSAIFYPVFNYIEKDGENLKITLGLYANSGTFADTLTNDMFSFGYDFKDGSVVSIERTSDTTAELIISVPANGQTEDTFNMNGEVVAASGTLINSWKDAKNSKTEYLRNYTQGSMGKNAAAGYLTDADIDAIKKVVSEYGNTTFGTIKDVASGAYSAAKAIETLCDMTGIIETEADKLKKIYQQVAGLQVDINDIKTTLSHIQEDNYKAKLSDFDTDVAMLITYTDYIAGYFKDIKAQLPDPPADDASDDDWKEYNSTLAKALSAAGGQDYSNKLANLQEYYAKVVADLLKADTQNPLYIFDDLCTYTYNFDSSSHPERVAYRVHIDYVLKRALSHILVAFENGNNPNYVSQCDKNKELYTTALTEINNHAVAGLSSNSAYFYILAASTFYQDPVKADYSFDADYADPYYRRNFSSSEIDTFVTRMNGRTLRQEMEKAGFKVDDKTTVGCSFNWYHKSEGSIFKKYTNYYADIIKWDDTGKTMGQITYTGNGSKVICQAKLWM